ncbi:flavodoxin [Bifidobacterium sp. ESL0790]|uniref:flavodoxin n=1 Tax=Bifidobacterium sp. ESL0790 TaxID=2983233 RepID=UPI0023F6EEF7|nr:flavodoxin [Bifidobacterium sp. ESL0790]WEV73051.1 flavodoxin [Bifidobacterium sp. ESL0790]
MNKKALVVYFSATGNTESAAKKLAKATGADIKRIVPAQPYSAADLDWNDSSSRTSVEHRDQSIRPKMAEPVHVDGYDVVFVGFPLWWESAPLIVRTFLESQDFSGKTIVTFATSGSSINGADGRRLHDSASNADWKVGRRFAASDTEQTFASWVDGLGL